MSAVARARSEAATNGSGLQPIQVVAEYLSISRSKVYQLMETGALPYVKLGKSRRVRWSDVLNLVNQNLVGQP